MVKICDNCNIENPDDAGFCSSCGGNSLHIKSSSKPPKLVCPKCQNVSTNLWPDEFCQNCGSSLDSKTNQTLPEKKQTLPKQQQADPNNTLPQTNQTLPEKKQTQSNNIPPKQKSNNLLFIIPAAILIFIVIGFFIRLTAQTGIETPENEVANKEITSLNGSIPDSNQTSIPEPTYEPQPTPTPGPIKYYYYLNAEENMRNEQFSAALDNINKYIELNNNDPDGYFIRARVFQRSGSRQQSIIDYDRAIKLQPDNPKSYRYRANTYRELKQYERAIEDYTKSIQLDPSDENEWSYRFIAGSYFETQQYEKAITNWERYAEIQLYKLNNEQSKYAKERLTDTHVSIGEAYRELGRYEMAMQNFQRALDITPFYNDAIKGAEKVNLLVESHARRSQSKPNKQSSNKFDQDLNLTRRYEHKTAGFSISFPDDWDLMEHSDQTPPPGVLQDVDIVNRNNLIRLEVQQNNGFNLDEWQNTFIQDRWDFNVNKTEKIDSLPAYLNHGTGMGPETDTAILIYANDKWLISIVFILEGMDTDTYETIVDGVVDSIILVD